MEAIIFAHTANNILIWIVLSELQNIEIKKCKPFNGVMFVRAVWEFIFQKLGILVLFYATDDATCQIKQFIITLATNITPLKVSQFLFSIFWSYESISLIRMLFAVWAKIMATLFEKESISKYVQVKSFVHFHTFYVAFTYCLQQNVPKSFAGDGTQRALKNFEWGPNSHQIHRFHPTK